MALRQRPAAVRRREPRLLNNPFEFSMGLMFVVVCASNVQYLLQNPTMPPIGLLALPRTLLWCWIISIGAGGVLVCLGLVAGTSRRWARAAEASGLWLTAGAWATLTVTLISISAAQYEQYGQSAAVVAGCFLRLLALHRIERAVTEVAKTEEQAE